MVWTGAVAMMSCRIREDNLIVRLRAQLKTQATRSEGRTERD